MNLKATLAPIVHVAVQLNQSAQALIQARLAEHGFSAAFLNEPALVQQLPNIEWLLLGRPPRINWSTATRLRLIHVAGTGIDPLFPAQGLSETVHVTNSRGAHADAVRDHVLMLALALTRDLPRAFEQQRRKEWKSYSTPSIARQRWVVLGYGAIGRRVSEAALALGVQVHAIARTARPDHNSAVADVVRGAPHPELNEAPPVSGPNHLAMTQQASSGLSQRSTTKVDAGVISQRGSLQVSTLEQLEAALINADTVILCLPLTDETRGLFSAERVALLPPSATLINVSRGGILDEAALLQRLQQGTLRGAALDVFEQEPLPANAPHWTCPRLLVTPHNAGFTPDYLEPVLDELFASIGAIQHGETPLNSVSRRSGY